MGDEQRINYGVIFQKHLKIDFATDYWKDLINMNINIFFCDVSFELLQCGRQF
jgi:hypothetical protein